MSAGISHPADPHLDEDGMCVCDCVACSVDDDFPCICEDCDTTKCGMHREFAS